MVSSEADQSKAIKQNKSHHHFGLIISMIILGVSIALFSFIFCFLVVDQFYQGNRFTISNVQETPVEEPAEEQKIEYKEINFQPVIDSFAKSVGGNKSVLVYDLEREELAGEYNISEKYTTASLYKLFVVYEGYRRVENHEWEPNEKAGSTGHTVLECLDLAIRESHSPCAETLWSKIGRTELDNIILNDFKITHSNISNFISTPEDILEILKIFYKHPDISDEKLLARMKDSFLNQPETTYNWRQGLPSGFKTASVYNKVGWDFNPNGKYWNIYHDAAIVEFPEDNRHFIVVVMTNRVPFQKITQFGTSLENYYLENR